MPLSKELEAKMRKYNKIRSEADTLQHEIERDLNNEFDVFTPSFPDTHGDRQELPYV